MVGSIQGGTIRSGGEPGSHACRPPARVTPRPWDRLSRSGASECARRSTRRC
jgi:hypothetical protein